MHNVAISKKYINAPTSQIPGDLKRLKIPSIGWTGGNTGYFDYRKKLRTINKTINIDASGINTSIEYLEDWELA